MLILYFDGLCEPRNPGGWVSYGWLIERGGVELTSGKGIASGPGPDSTNNVAEYAALIAGLEALTRFDLGGQVVEVRGDSQLVIRQVSGEWQCRSDRLRPLFRRARVLAAGLPVSFRWVRRERNAEADALARQAYDEARAEGLGEFDRRSVTAGLEA